MISKLAQSTYQQWISEGLKPTLQDCIDLNAAGVQLECNSDSSSFYCVPRIGFLGDFIFKEPTIAKRIYVDEIREVVGEDPLTNIYAICYCLYTPTDELVELKSKKDVVETIARFVKEVLSGFTETQIYSMIDYVMNGHDTLKINGNYADNTTSSSCIPESCQSYARTLLNKAIAGKLDSESCDRLTIEQLEKVLFIAALNEGIESMKDKNCEYVGKYYTVSGKIHTRLMKEKKDLEKDNG